MSKIYQRLSYKACFIISPNLFEFGVVILVFRDMLPLYTNSLLLCYEDIWDPSVTASHDTDDRRLK